MENLVLLRRSTIIQSNGSKTQRPVFILYSKQLCHLNRLKVRLEIYTAVSSFTKEALSFICSLILPVKFPCE